MIYYTFHTIKQLNFEQLSLNSDSSPSLPTVAVGFETQCENAKTLEAFSICGNNFLLEFWLSPPKKVLALAKAFYSSFLRRSPKKNKNSHWSERSANNLVFYWIRAVNKGVAPQTAAAYGFWREIKTLVFGVRKKRWTS